jgi:hypothetical protein
MIQENPMSFMGSGLSEDNIPEVPLRFVESGRRGKSVDPRVLLLLWVNGPRDYANLRRLVVQKRKNTPRSRFLRTNPIPDGVRDDRMILVSDGGLIIRTPESSDSVGWTELVDWIEDASGFALFHPMISEFTGFVPKRVFTDEADMDWFRERLGSMPRVDRFGDRTFYQISNFESSATNL